jgi:hypothetical protein
MEPNKKKKPQTTDQEQADPTSPSEEEPRMLEPLDPQALSEEEQLREAAWDSFMERTKHLDPDQG